MGEKPAAGKSRGLQCHTLNSSDISDTKEEICFMSLSTLLSLPVFSSVVMARVAMLRLESVMRFSRSRLQAVTADGCFMATCKERDSKLYGRNNILQLKAFDMARIKAPFVSAFQINCFKLQLTALTVTNCFCCSIKLQNQYVISFTHTLFMLFCGMKYLGLCFLAAGSSQVIQLQLVIAPWSRNQQT